MYHLTAHFIHSRIFTMEEFIQSFKDKINSRGQIRREVPESPTIISRSSTQMGTAQHQQRPRHVSIGPLHWGDSNLQMFEHHKWRLIYILDLRSLRFDKLWICFFGLKDLEETARKTYSVVVEMTSYEFIEMLFLDACFIILRVTAEQAKPQEVSSTTTYLQVATTRLSQAIQMLDFNKSTLEEIDIDLVKLDNQIPFFIIEFVWKWLGTILYMESPLDLTGHLLKYFGVPIDLPIPQKIHHLLHLLHSTAVPQGLEGCITYNRYYRPWLPNATQLKEVGINFRLNPSRCSFLDIRFENDEIHIPVILMTETERHRLENFVDFEQSVPGIITHFSNYVRIMSYILSKEDDVRILFKNSVGWDKEVQQFFHSLEQRCCYWHADTFLDDVFIEINKYRKSKRARWKASFRRKYCSNPWVTLTTRKNSFCEHTIACTVLPMCSLMCSPKSICEHSARNKRARQKTCRRVLATDTLRARRARQIRNEHTLRAHVLLLWS